MKYHLLSANMQKFYNCTLILALAILIFPSCGKEEEGVLLKKSEVEENFNQLINGDDKAHYEAINFFKSKRPESVFLYIQRPHQQGGKQERLPLSTLLGLDPNTYRKQPIYYFDCSLDQQGIVDLQIIEYLSFESVTQLFASYKEQPDLRIQELLRSTFSDNAQISFSNDPSTLVLEDYYIKLQRNIENVYPVSSYGAGRYDMSFKIKEITMKYLKNAKPIIPSKKTLKNILSDKPELVSINEILIEIGPVIEPPQPPDPEPTEDTPVFDKNSVKEILESRLNMIRLHGNKERNLDAVKLTEIKNEIFFLCLNNAIDVSEQMSTTPQDTFDIGEGDENPTLLTLIRDLQVTKPTKNAMLPPISITDLTLNRNNKVVNIKFNYRRVKN